MIGRVGGWLVGWLSVLLQGGGGDRRVGKEGARGACGAAPPAIQQPDVSPGLRTSCNEGHGFLTSPQLSCQRSARLRFNEEKNIISLVSV